VTETAGTSGDISSACGSQKRGPCSLGLQSGQAAKQVKTASKHPGEMSDLIGWLEQKIYQEKDKKKLGVQIAEKILFNLNILRTLTQIITYESSRLTGELNTKEDAHVEIITVFISKLDPNKNAETSSLRAELEALKAHKQHPA